MIDQQSQPDAWQTEWDRRAHLVEEFRQEIRELRSRIASCLRQIKELESENALLRASAGRCGIDV